MSKKKQPVNTSNTLPVHCKEGGDEAKALAETLIRPTVQAARTIKAFEPTEMDLGALIGSLVDQTNLASGGDMKRMEALLVNQAHALDTVFGYYMRKARDSQYLEHLKIYANLGLRAQSQCRASVEALAEIKNPRPYIQNNKAQYQQVNNGVRMGKEKPLAHGEENPKTANKLLEDNTHEWMDTGTQSTASGTDKDLEALGTKHRPEDR